MAVATLSVSEMSTSSSINDQFRPTDRQREIIELLEEGRVNPRLIRENTDMSKQTIEYHLTQLRDAGWVTKVTRGLYELDSSVSI